MTKYLHTMIRVTDPDATDPLFRADWMRERGASPSRTTQGRFTLIFLAAPGDEDAQVELTYNWPPEDGSTAESILQPGAISAISPIGWIIYTTPASG
jgi:lactoylglutathione lyase